MVKTTYYPKKQPTKLTARDMDRLREDASVGILDIDYARWVEEQLIQWIKMVISQEARIAELEIEKRDLKRQARENSLPKQEKPKKKEPGIHCSFCGKGQYRVAKIIAGPSVYICNECIDICNEIITED